MKYSILFIALIAATPVHAAPVDMATQTCQDWLDADDDVQDGMVAWLNGYLASRGTTTLYDPATARARWQTLKGYCQAHKDLSLLTAASQVKR